MADADYDRGVRDGEINAQLADHGRRLDAVNGSIAATAVHLAALTKAVQGLTYAASMGEKTRAINLKKWQLVLAVAALAAPAVLRLMGVG